MSLLSGIRVVELTHVFAGPFAAYQLALQGADVIRIENPDDPDQSRSQGSDPTLNAALMGTSYLAQAGSKRSVTLDLKNADDQARAKQILASADVVIDNFRPGAMDALGMGPHALREARPDLIYCSISAYGTTGPRAGLTAYDNVIQAACGMMALTGRPGDIPVKTGTQVIDYATGQSAAYAICAALFRRASSGLGAHLDVSMYECALMLGSAHATGFLQTGKLPARQGNQHRYASSGCYDIDGVLLMLGASNLRQYRRLHQALDTGWPAEDHTDADRVRLHAEEAAAIAAALSRRPLDETLDALHAAGVPASRVRTLDEALADPQVESRGFIGQVDSPVQEAATPVLLAPFIVDGARGHRSLSTSPLGVDTADVLNKI